MGGEPKNENTARQRKKFRKLHGKIVDGEIGYKYNSDILKRYFSSPGQPAHPVCGYIRSPRVNAKYDAKHDCIPSRIYGLCQFSPNGVFENDGFGVCNSAFPMVGANRCKYKEKFILEHRLDSMREIDGVRFRSGDEVRGLSGYVRWGNRYLVVDIDLEKKSEADRKRDAGLERFGYNVKKRNSVCRITVLGTLDKLYFDDNGHVVEETVAVPKRKQKNVRNLLLGLENHFLRELKNWSFVEEDAKVAYPDKRNFKNRIRIPA